MDTSTPTMMVPSPVKGIKIQALSAVNGAIVFAAMFLFFARDKTPVSPTPTLALIIAVLAVVVGFAGVAKAHLSVQSRGWVWNEGILAPSDERLAPEQIDTSSAYFARVRVQYQIGLVMSEAAAIYGFIVGFNFGAAELGAGLIGFGFLATITSATFCFRICKTITALEKLEQFARTAQAR